MKPAFANCGLSEPSRTVVFTCVAIYVVCLEVFQKRVSKYEVHYVLGKYLQIGRIPELHEYVNGLIR